MQCLANRDVTELIKVEKNLTIDVAISGKRNCQLVKENEQAALKAVTGAIIMASEYFNVGGKISEVQAIQIASLFLEQYPAETFEDLILCLKYAKTGKYGKVYNRIDGLVIFEWFQAYLDEKYERFEQIKNEEKFNHYESNSSSFENIGKAIAPLFQEQIEPEKQIPSSFSDVKHFESFKESLVLCNRQQLMDMRRMYMAENKKTMFSNFDNYIDLIDSQLKSLSTKSNVQ